MNWVILAKQKLEINFCRSACSYVKSTMHQKKLKNGKDAQTGKMKVNAFQYYCY